jgi:putative transposase
MKTPELKIYRRKLPHWRLEGSVYFVTWRLAPGQPPLTPLERSVVMTAIRHFENQRYHLPAYAIMDDHVHVLVMPLDENRLHRIVHSWKSFAANQLTQEFGRKAPIWQREYFDRIVRDDDELMEKARYILNNPFARWPELDEYEWVGFGEGVT